MVTDLDAIRARHDHPHSCLGDDGTKPGYRLYGQVYGQGDVPCDVSVLLDENDRLRELVGKGEGIIREGREYRHAIEAENERLRKVRDAAQALLDEKYDRDWSDLRAALAASERSEP